MPGRGGARVSSRLNGVDHVYSYGLGSVLHDDAGSAVYTPGVSQRVNGADRFFHDDWLGSTRYLTDGTGLRAPTSRGERITDLRRAGPDLPRPSGWRSRPALNPGTPPRLPGSKT